MKRSTCVRGDRDAVAVVEDVVAADVVAVVDEAVVEKDPAAAKDLVDARDLVAALRRLATTSLSAELANTPDCPKLESKSAILKSVDDF